MTRPKNPKASELDGSWVVDDSEAEPTSSSSSDYPEPSFEPSIRLRRGGKGKTQGRDRAARASEQSSPKSRASRKGSKSAAEPELIMPSIREVGMEDSWVVSDASRVKQPSENARQPGSRCGTPLRSPQTQRLRSVQISPNTHGTGGGHGEHNDGLEKIMAMVYPILSWLSEVTMSALRLLKTPISMIFALYLLAVLLQITQNFITTSIYSALSPICRIPGASLLDLPMCRGLPSLGRNRTQSSAPVEFNRLMNTQSHFEEILATSSNAVSLPYDMKRSETSIRDLHAVVKFSSLTAKQELGLEFEGFIETARLASYDLQRFNGHVGRAVDSVISIDRWTTRILSDIEHNSRSRGLIPSFVSNTLLYPFQPVKATAEAALLDQYISHTSLVATEITRLTAEAQALLSILQSLEDRLSTIHDISIREDIAASANREDLLAHLWTMLGGNRKQLSKFNEQLKLLREVGEYRRTAHAHVAKTILKLQSMGAELEELRERVGSAGAGRNAGVEIPLSVHLESLRKGVERLEDARGKERRIQGQVHRGVLDRAEGPKLVDGDEEVRRIDAGE